MREVRIWKGLGARVGNEYDQNILYKILKELIKYIFKKESVDLSCLHLVREAPSCSGSSECLDWELGKAQSK